jgi:hypothetical protein
MNKDIFFTLRNIVQVDIGNRGLASDPESNLFSAHPGDLGRACGSIAQAKDPSIVIVTGFLIPTAAPPTAETDGPLGALFLARALAPLGIKVAIASDDFCLNALSAGLDASGMEHVRLVRLPSHYEAATLSAEAAWETVQSASAPTHLIALERAGPSHTPESVCRHQDATEDWLRTFLQEVPPEHHDRCHTMRGGDITHVMSPAHWLFEEASRKKPAVHTIGIGDGGNEIGMGKIGWEVIRRNVPGGAVTACRVPTDDLIVCGISNWGAYALATGVATLLGQKPTADLYDPNRERELLRLMVERGPLVDGVLGRPSDTVDGQPFEKYIEPLLRLGELFARP